MSGYGIGGYLIRTHVALLYLTCYPAHGIGNLPARRVADGQHQGQPGTMGSVVDTLAQAGVGKPWHAREVAYHRQTHVVFYQIGRLPLDGYDNQIHQSIDLGLRTIPVFGRECIERKIADTYLRGNLGDFSYSIHTLDMSFRTVETA